jgi:hypothetical protein
MGSRLARPSFFPRVGSYLTNLPEILCWELYENLSIKVQIWFTSGKICLVLYMSLRAKLYQALRITGTVRILRDCTTNLRYTYMVRLFNSRNGPVKAKFAYICTNGCCLLRNTLLVRLCTSWNYGATDRNSLENHFPEFLAVTFSRFVGCQKGQQIFVPSGQFLILGRAKNCRWLSQVTKADGPFL